MSARVHICSFQSLDSRVSRNTKYEDVKRVVLKAGRFSVFEATDNQWAAGLFTRLCHDPELVTDHSLGYPWTCVRLKEKP